MPEIWERQPCDTAKSWRAFQDFLKLGHTRTLRKLHSRYTQRKRPPSTQLSTIEKWSSEGKWYKRADAWDASVGKASLEKAKDVVADRFADKTRAYLEEKEEIARSKIERGKNYENILNALHEHGVLPTWMPRALKMKDLVDLEALADKPISRGDEMMLDALGLGDGIKDLEADQ